MHLLHTHQEPCTNDLLSPSCARAALCPQYTTNKYPAVLLRPRMLTATAAK